MAIGYSSYKMNTVGLNAKILRGDIEKQMLTQSNGSEQSGTSENLTQKRKKAIFFQNETKMNNIQNRNSETRNIFSLASQEKFSICILSAVVNSLIAPLKFNSKTIIASIDKRSCY